MIIKTKRTRFRFIFDVLLTILGWAIFVDIFAFGILAMWRDEIGGPDVLFLPSALSANMMSVVGYIVLMGCFSIWLIIWAKYNQHRFAGVDRRKPPAPLVASQLLASFGVSEDQLGLMQTSRSLVVTHKQDGSIQTIEQFLDQVCSGFRIKNCGEKQTVETQVSDSIESDSALAQADEEKPRQKTLLSPAQFVVHYVPDTSWARQYNAYNASP